MRKYFEFQNGVKINCGENALSTIPTELAYYGAKKPLFLVSSASQKLGVVAKVKNVIKAASVKEGGTYEYDKPLFQEDEARKIKAAYNDKKCDAIIAIGGDPVLESAKCARLFLTEDCDELVPMIGIGNAKTKEIPLIVIPTENGTGKEAGGHLETNENYVSSRSLVPNVVIIDEEVALTAPTRTVAACGVAALANAVDAYLNTEEESPIEIYAEKAIRLLSKHLLKAVENGEDEDACRATVLAGTLAGIAYAEAPYGASHALAKGVADITGEPIEEMYSLTLVPSLESALKYAQKRVKNMLLAIVGADEYADTPNTERTQRTIKEIATLLEKLREISNIPTKISQTKINREDFGKIAEAASNTRAAIAAFDPITKDDFLALLNAAY